MELCADTLLRWMASSLGSHKNHQEARSESWLVTRCMKSMPKSDRKKVQKGVYQECCQRDSQSEYTFQQDVRLVASHDWQQSIKDKLNDKLQVEFQEVSI